MIGQFFDIMILASTDEGGCKKKPSKFKSWKVLDRVAKVEKFNNQSGLIMGRQRTLPVHRGGSRQ